MKSKVESLNDEQRELFEKLNELNKSLNEFSSHKYNRINPFYENLFDWKEKGFFVSGKTNNTIYESCTLIGNIQMGDGCWFGPYTMLDGGGGLNIGNNVTVSTGAMIFTHDTLKHTLSDGKAPFEYEKVVIGDNCFIGSGAIILKGSIIEDHVLVSANALVHGHFKAYSIVAGSPAKVIGKVVPIGDDISLEYYKKSED